MIRLLHFFFLFILAKNHVYGQYEFFNNGVNITVNDVSSIDANISTTPALFVKGTLSNTNGGILTNSGEIQLTGDWIQNDGSQLISSGDEVFVGANSGTPDVLYNKYRQRIIGNTANSFIGNDYDFYNLVIVKPSRTSTNYSTVDIDKNVEVKNSLCWRNSGTIRTDTITHDDDGQEYGNEIFLKNPNPTALIGYSTTVGATNNFIEGKLRRAVDRVGSYYFPVGIDPYHTIGGMNAFQLDFSATPTSSGVLGYLESNNLVPMGNSGYIYCDVGKVDTNNVTIDSFVYCIGSPDGFIDRLQVTGCNQLYQWSVTSDNVSGSYNYDIEVFPTSGCEGDALCGVVPTVCGSLYSGMYMTWLAHNGVPDGTPTTSGVPTLWQSPTYSQAGYYVCPRSNFKKISAQVGFSKFRLHGVLIPFTLLPIELVSFTLTPIDNQYFLLQWATESQRNAKEFILERSMDGILFYPIHNELAAGNSSQYLNYNYGDKDVYANTNYYYRLKLVDNDNTYTYSEVLSGRLIQDEVLNIYPNPTSGMIFSSIPYESASIFDNLGQIVRRYKNNEQIDISDLASSTYFIKINTKGTNYNFKIVKE